MEDMIFGKLNATEDKRVNIKDILEFIFRNPEIEQKTILSHDNINAIIKMRALNKYCELYYGWTLEIFQTLIDEKRLNVISYDGIGRKDIISAIQAMQDNILSSEQIAGKNKGIL